MGKLKYLKGYVKDIKQGDKGASIYGAVASTELRDRDGDIISSLGWELDNFKKAPRLLWSHDASLLPIGKVTNIQVKNNQLEFDAQFATEENKFASDVAKMFKNGYLNTFSVGFIPKDSDDQGNITKQELLEISAVNIPANPEARTQLSYKNFSKKSIKQSKTSAQTLILSKERYKTEKEAKSWAEENDFKTTKIDETSTSFRFRQFDPGECSPNSMRTIQLSDGVSAVVCRRADDNKSNDKKEDNNKEDNKVVNDKEDEKLLLLNHIASLKEAVEALEKKLDKLKASTGNNNAGDKPQKQEPARKASESRELRSLKMADRVVEYYIRQFKKKGGAK